MLYTSHIHVVLECRIIYCCAFHCWSNFQFLIDKGVEFGKYVGMGSHKNACLEQFYRLFLNLASMWGWVAIRMLVLNSINSF